MFQQWLKDQYLQTWYAAISLNSKLSMYAEFKRAYIHEPYLNVVTIRKYRRALASFRTSSHRLQVERGRHLNIPRNERKCAVCQTSIEDEYHFLMVCPLYNDIRQTYIPNDYINIVNIHNFNSLMQTIDEDLIRHIAMFLYYAFQRRATFYQT